MASKRIIYSPDLKRSNRIPPGQVATEKWPVLHYGPVPDYAQQPFDFQIYGLVDHPQRFTMDELQNLPKVEVHSDIHWGSLSNPLRAIVLNQWNKTMD